MIDSLGNIAGFLGCVYLSGRLWAEGEAAIIAVGALILSFWFIAQALDAVLPAGVKKRRRKR